VPKPVPAAAPKLETTEPTSSRSVSALAIGGIVALVLGIAVSWLWFSGAYLKLLGREPVQSAATAESSPARLLIDEFLLANDWSDATVAQFNFRWKTLEIEDRRAAFDSLWLPEFIEAVRSHVKEQRALSAGEAEHRIAGPLAELAATFGIDVSAPDRVVLPAALRESQAPAIPASQPPPAAIADVKPAVTQTEARAPATQPPPKTTTASAPTTTPRRETPAKTPAPAQAAPAPAAAAAPAGVTGEKQTQKECSVVPVRSRKPLCQDPLTIGGFGPAISLISVAPFPMGSTAAAEERPVRTVTLAKPFGLSMYEISQREFRTYCMATGRTCPPQPAEGDELPVVNVTWNEARGYAEWLSSVTGQRYRLPSEAEWEFAARAGETAIYPQNIQLAPSDAWFSGAQRRTGVGPRTAGKLNAFNVAHMLGNAREWVLDGWTPNHEGAPLDGTARSPDAAGNRVVRGGSYVDTAPRLRLSLRDKQSADTRDPTTGFRVAREIP
jgi:formylglycine-generating enzyme required for sulfatase activity